MDVGGQEVSRSKSHCTGGDSIDDWPWSHKIAGAVMGFDEILVMCMARRGVALCFTWHEKNGKYKCNA